MGTAQNCSKVGVSFLARGVSRLWNPTVKANFPGSHNDLKSEYKCTKPGPKPVKRVDRCNATWIRRRELLLRLWSIILTKKSCGKRKLIKLLRRVCLEPINLSNVIGKFGYSCWIVKWRTVNLKTECLHRNSVCWYPQIKHKIIASELGSTYSSWTVKHDEWIFPKVLPSF